LTAEGGEGLGPATGVRVTIEHDAASASLEEIQGALLRAALAVLRRITSEELISMEEPD
jgi:hypothetical protein